MRILFLSNSVGGLINFRFELLKALVQRGDEVYLSSQIEPEISPKPLVDIGCRFIETKMNQRGTNPFDEFKLIKEYKRILSEVKPNIVLTYTIKPNIYGSVACRKLKVPVVANITGIGMALENTGVLQKTSILLYRWGLKKTDFVFFQNHESIDFFAEHKIKSKAQSLIAGSGVNLEKFKFMEYPDDNGEIHFLYVGRILPKKGMQQFIDAALFCHEHYPQAKFHIVGIKDDPYYTQQIVSLDEQGIIKYHGKQADTRPFVKSVNALVHPSYYPEGLSNVCLESSAMGRPVITTDKSGCKETVDDGVTGYIVKQQDSKDLIDKVVKFINLPYKQKVAMGKAAHEKVSREFNRADVVKRYLDTIDRLAK